MLRSEITFTLLCVLLIRHHVEAVINKSQASSATEEKKENEVKADERISNSYGPPSSDYGPPSGSDFKGPAPVYGPPELVGDQGPTPIYPPPPPDVPPPAFGPPLASYGPPRIKPHFGPPKQNYGPPLSLPSKLSFGSLKLHYGPPKQHYGPPYSFTAFRPPKTQYGPPLKFSSAVSSQFTTIASSGHGSVKPGHSLPVSLDAYGPPQKLAVQFTSQPSDNYGPPPQSLPNIQYGPPAGDLYRPPPGPLPGVPAPPTPPDIKYDGWQPIAGLASQHGSVESYGAPLENYGVPDSEQKNIHGSSINLHVSQSSSNAAAEHSNVPSDSYGLPIHNPEAQDLKSSVSSGSSDNDGLPPPPLPQYEPFHNENQAHLKKEEQKVPNVEPLSIVKTVGFELLPTSGPLVADLNVGSLPTLKLPVVDSGAQLNLDHGVSHAFQNIGNDLSLTQVNALSGSYGQPLPIVSLGHSVNSIEAGFPLPPPPVLDTYSAPPLSSYSSNGPYPAAESGRSSSLFSSFGLQSSSLFKQNVHHHRPHGSFRTPLSPPASLIPPRNRDPIKFKEAVPSGLLTNLNRYLPPPPRHFGFTKATKSFIPPFSFEQKLPSPGAPIAFHKLNGFDFNSPIAAPNVHYGTPLSFGDFNTPAPILTYGAPNFGPPSSFISTSTGFGKNLYDSVSNTITTTYGTPIINAPQTTGVAHDCGFQQGNGLQYNLHDTGTHAGGLESFGQAHSADLNRNTLLKVEQLPTGSGGPSALGQLNLEKDQNLGSKDSYGNSVGATYNILEHADSVLSSDHSQGSEVANVLAAPPSAPTHDVVSSNTQYHQEGGIRAEALTTALNEQEFGRAKNLGSGDVDASQFLSTHEGSEALSLAKGLTIASGRDGFEIQGSKGTYMLQIQPADGGLGTENSDGSIRHDQVLSNGLLQDILAAIEQPERGHVQLQGLPEAQSLQHVYSDLPHSLGTDVPKGHYITVDDDTAKTNVKDLVGHAEDRNEVQLNDADPAKKEGVAFFFNNQYGDSKKETRSVVKSETVVTASSNEGKTVGKEKSS
ncbi:uncharacterized protein LOC116433582 [Nomia melanderi]|uniref:uncharacterized protein LOC116433582 n=1 Tax=Nomia melanderi TaxID=2448451 RepID=UPI001304583A|nr:proline-rich extensin-like protein EPR1 [Nomia melanderi]